MKKFILAVLLTAPLSLMAQMKVGHYDLQAVVQDLPAYKTAQSELEALGKTYESNLEDMQKEYNTKLQKYQSEINEQTPKNMVERAQKDLEEMQKKIETAAQDNQRAFQESMQQKLSPIFQKVNDAVAAVAKEGGYIYLLDPGTMQTSQATNFYVNPTMSEDVTAKIKARLGL
ncbi:MAG: OmpH family outer membrane protein [Alloprevotella sp.]|nr:OmpH family outer membrane protein [Alloprevotella sp.]MBR1595043.1 OmpH family outer membrane protein [Alloprevotella sp.]